MTENHPLCPNGCYKRKPMQWADDSWYCPKCGDEWVEEVFNDKD